MKRVLICVLGIMVFSVSLSEGVGGGKFGRSYKGVAPVDISGTQISIPEASATQDGFISKEDYSSFDATASSATTNAAKIAILEVSTATNAGNIAVLEESSATLKGRLDNLDTGDVAYTNPVNPNISNQTHVNNALIGHMANITDDVLLEKTSVWIAVTGGVASFHYCADDDCGSFNANINQSFVTISSGTVTLTGGTATVPKRYYVYATSNAVVVASETDPDDAGIEHAEVGEAQIYEVFTTSATVSQVWSGITATYESIHGLTQRLYITGGQYSSGGSPTFSGTGERLVAVSVVKGYIGKSDFTTDAVVAGSTITWVNDPDTPYSNHYSIDIAKYANGDAFSNNKYINIVIFAALANESKSILYMNAPTGETKYISLSDAENDEKNQAVYTIPSDLKSGSVLICRVIYKVVAGALVKQDFEHTTNPVAEYQNLRGVLPSAAGGGGSGGGGGSRISDDDNDTYFETEYTADEDTTREYAGGTKVSTGTPNGKKIFVDLTVGDYNDSKSVIVYDVTHPTQPWKIEVIGGVITATKP